MYTIIMNENKELVTSKRATLYQREKLADKIQFLFPLKYEDVDFNEFVAVLKYIDQGNIYHSEVLAKSSELYKDKLRFILPVDTKLNYFAGNILIHINMKKIDADTGTSETLLKTSEVMITINPENYVEPSDDFTNKLVALEAQVSAINEKVDSEDGCDCEDNVVEFGDSFVETPDEGNVVEF